MAGSRHEAGKDRMLELMTNMSDEDQDRPLIRNEDTLRRRAWIDRALAGVRERLQPDAASMTPPEVPPAKPRSRPRLYVVRKTNPR